jgi:hypothetical protein
MAIFTDKRELNIQKKRKLFRGKRNWLSKAATSSFNPINYIPGGKTIMNLAAERGATGDEREFLEDVGRKEAIAGDIQTAQTYMSVLGPGGMVANVATGMAADAAAGKIREDAYEGGGASGGEKGNYQDYLSAGGDLTRKEWRKSGKPGSDAMSVAARGAKQNTKDALEETVNGMELMEESPDVDFKGAVMDDGQKKILDEMNTEAFNNPDILPTADASKYTTAFDAGATGGEAAGAVGKKGFLGIGKGGKLGAGLQKFQQGKFMKGMATAGQVAGIATSAAGLVTGQMAMNKRMDEARKRKRAETLSNEYYSFA